MLQAQGLTKSFAGAPALQDINLDAAAGEFLAIIGPSGCGKSTLLRCLNFIEIPDAGSVTVNGVALHRTGKGWNRQAQAQAHRLRAEIGMVFQGFFLFPHRSVIHNIMLAPMAVKHLPRDAARAQAEALLAKVGLSTFADRLPATLSGGQQQRAAIARALAMKPRVMLYDEPTSALDPALVQEVLQVMRDLDTEGMTQIVVTHEFRFAQAAADTILYMQAGQIIERASPDILFNSPSDPRTRSFLSRLT